MSGSKLLLAGNKEIEGMIEDPGGFLYNLNILFEFVLFSCPHDHKCIAGQESVKREVALRVQTC